MERDTAKCRCCDGSGTVSHWLFWTKPCSACEGKGISYSPLYGLSEEDRRKVLKRNPDPADLKRLGIQITTVWPPFKKPDAR